MALDVESREWYLDYTAMSDYYREAVKLIMHRIRSNDI
jgi:hypothetical protein